MMHGAEADGEADAGSEADAGEDAAVATGAAPAAEAAAAAETAAGGDVALAAGPYEELSCLAYRLMPDILHPPTPDAHPVPARQASHLLCGGCSGKLLRAQFSLEETELTAKQRR